MVYRYNSGHICTGIAQVGTMTTQCSTVRYASIHCWGVRAPETLGELFNSRSNPVLGKSRETVLITVDTWRG
jgi:hypothetical protein